MNQEEKYKEALELIMKDCGAVCSNYGLCEHGACSSSHRAYELAAHALGIVEEDCHIFEELK